MINTNRMEEAATWLQRLHSQPHDDRMLSEWLEWCRADPGHLETFEQLQAVWEAFDETEVRQAAHAVRPRVAEKTRSARSQVRNALIGVAAAAALLVAGMSLWRSTDWSNGGVRTLTTAVAEHGNEILADGSQVELGAKTRIVTRYTIGERSVRIESGEAFFKVAKDRHRPFVVDAGALRVTAVGTAFSVRRGMDRTTVTVSEGVVRVAPDAAERTGHEVKATAGEQVTFTESSSSLTIARVEPSVATSWRQGVLKFMDEPLGSVISNVNRYSSRRIILEDADLAARPFTGTVYEGRIDEWLYALERVFPLDVVDEHDGVVRLQRRSN